MRKEPGDTESLGSLALCTKNRKMLDIFYAYGMMKLLTGVTNAVKRLLSRNEYKAPGRRCFVLCMVMKGRLTATLFARPERFTDHGGYENGKHLRLENGWHSEGMQRDDPPCQQLYPDLLRPGEGPGHLGDARWRDAGRMRGGRWERHHSHLQYLRAYEDAGDRRCDLPGDAEAAAGGIEKRRIPKNPPFGCKPRRLLQHDHYL
nr:MAG TPA: hypothetical protein [Caudoviricetes sp.]